MDADDAPINVKELMEAVQREEKRKTRKGNILNWLLTDCAKRYNTYASIDAMIVMMLNPKKVKIAMNAAMTRKLMSL